MVRQTTFDAYFLVYYVMSMVVIVTMVVMFTPGSVLMWLLLAQTMYSTAVVATAKLVPAWVDKHKHLFVMKAAKPLAIALEVIFLYVLGMLYEYHSSAGASFAIFYVLLLALKVVIVSIYYMF